MWTDSEFSKSAIYDFHDWLFAISWQINRFNINCGIEKEMVLWQRKREVLNEPIKMGGRVHSTLHLNWKMISGIVFIYYFFLSLHLGTLHKLN